MTVIAELEPTQNAERERRDFAWRRGETKTIRFTMFQAGGDIEDLSQRFDLTAATIQLIMKKNATDPAAEVTLAVATGIIILTQTVGAATRGKFDATFADSDTSALPVGRHVYDARVDLGATGKETIAFGTITLIQEQSAI